MSTESDDDDTSEVKLKLTLPGHPTHIFNPGDQLVGQVVVETSKLILVERLNVRLLGLADVRWMGEKRAGVSLRRSRTLHQQETIVDQTSLLWPIAGEDDDNSLRIGSVEQSGGNTEEGLRKIEFTFHIPEDVPSTFKTKQIQYEVDISYHVEASLSYREITQTYPETSVDHGANGRATAIQQSQAGVVQIRQFLDFILLRTLDLKKESNAEEEVHLTREKVLTPPSRQDTSCSCFFNCACLKCHCCRHTGSNVSKSSTQIRDSKGNNFELCLKNEDAKGGGTVQGGVEKVWCALHLEKTGFVPGEDINVAAEVRNLSRKLIRATYVAMQQITELRFKISDELKDGSTNQETRRGLKDIFRISGGVVRTGDTAYYHDIIHIPPLPPTFQTADQLVGIGYSVTMGIIFEKEDNPLFEVSQPIVVGTIPLLDAHSPWATMVPSYSRYSHSSGEIEDYTEADCRQGRTSHVYKYYKTFWESPVT